MSCMHLTLNKILLIVICSLNLGVKEMSSSPQQLFVAAFERFRRGEHHVTRYTRGLSSGQIIAIRIALRQGVQAVTDLNDIFVDCDEESILAMINTVAKITEKKYMAV